jgi:6-pyruvoyltetrahydropterin/6-carboxytetrahydropterin synthase
MPYLLTKKFRFEAAHRIAKGYEGKCAHLHGHSWNGEVTVSCESVDDMDMGLDYKEIGTFARDMASLFDHACLLNEEDSELVALCNSQQWKTVLYPGANPTSEQIAKDIYDRGVGYFKQFDGVTLHQIVIEETCTSRCVYTGPQ